jgi:hypothetical protein
MKLHLIMPSLVRAQALSTPHGLEALIKIDHDRLWRIDVHETSNGKRKVLPLSADQKAATRLPIAKGFGDYGHLEGGGEHKAGWSALLKYLSKRTR